MEANRESAIGNPEDAIAEERPLRSQRLRWIARALVLAAAVALLAPPLGRSRLAAMVPGASPFVAVASALAAHTLEATTAVGLACAAIAIFRRRWFCRWVCPTGLCADAASRLGRRCGRNCPQLPAVGVWIALITLGGACLGYPVFLWLDPLAMLAAPFNLGTRDLGWLPWISAAGMLAVLGISLQWSGVWCLRLCPLGGLQELLNQVRRALLTERKPAAGGDAHPASVARRAVLGSMIGLAGAWLARTAGIANRRPLRPPGALEELKFVGLCVRCGNCLRACPSRVLVADSGEHGLAGLLTPRIRFDSDYCREDCTACMDVCPSGAIERHPLSEKPELRIGLAGVDMNVCLLGEDHECSVCARACPFEAISYVFSKAEYILIPRIDPKRCPGCGACEVACPTAPVKAITVREKVSGTFSDAKTLHIVSFASIKVPDTCSRTIQ